MRSPAPTLIPFACLAFSASAGIAQESDTVGSALRTPVERAGHERNHDHKVNFVAMPIPISNPAIGNGLGLAAMALYSPRGTARPWTTGVGGLYTDTDSRALFGFQKAYLGGDMWRVTVGGGAGIFNVNFYGIGTEAGSAGLSLPMEQKSGFGGGAILRHVTDHVHAGLLFRAVEMRTTFATSQLPLPTPIPDLELDSTVVQFGLGTEYDTRDNEYNPRKGIFAEAQWFYASEQYGSDFNYPNATIRVNGYHGLDPKSLIAWRGSLCWAGTGSPFYGLCQFGMQNDLRGYVSGQYRDHALFAVQTEYRRQLSKRWGFTTFIGVGEVARGISEFNSEDLLPAAGVGLRFMASEEYKVNLSIDYAVGKDSQAFYFYIGEAF